MDLVLELSVDRIIVREKKYYRCHIPKPASDRLGLQKHDKLIVTVNRVLRQGTLVFGDPTIEDQA